MRGRFMRGRGNRGMQAGCLVARLAYIGTYMSMAACTTLHYTVSRPEFHPGRETRETGIHTAGAVVGGDFSVGVWFRDHTHSPSSYYCICLPSCLAHPVEPA